MGMMRWLVKVMPRAEQQLAAISDKRIREGLKDSLKRLEHEPEKQGKPLKNELTGYRSVRAVGQRYRIIYKVEREQVVVLVVTVGMRREGDSKDVYALAKKLAKLGLLDQEE